MSLTTTSIRALGASIAIVASGATYAGAAVFHLPILGFGRTGVASAAAPATTAPTIAETHPRKVRPKVIVKTRVVIDVVHRPAPARAVSGRTSAPSAAAAAPRVTSPPHAPPALPVATVVTAPSTTPAWTEPKVPDVRQHESEPDDAAETDDRARVPAPTTTSTTTTSPADR